MSGLYSGRVMPSDSDARVENLAKRRLGYVKQSLLQSVGLRQRDLDPVARRYLDLYAKAYARLEAYDRWIADHGFLDERGQPPCWSGQYMGAVTTCSRLLTKVEVRLAAIARQKPTPLELVTAEPEEAEHFAAR